MNLILNIGVFMRYSKLNSLPYYYLTGLANATSVDTIILYKAELSENLLKYDTFWVILSGESFREKLVLQ